ncbi:hypothetical protein HOLleu_04084 [Holothuria leucospilota]|uniref:Uncharacterized protein n=1 Tax=Holothuria leucospilota TaxID=206669 RepID=A0A9Q1CU88_HOLLE|nr:hypothetical protein HOLleu_04084 [Holothuria leucospilota]
MGSSEVKSKISQVFPRLSSGVTRGQKAKVPKNSQNRYLGLSEVKKQNFPRIPKIVI